MSIKINCKLLSRLAKSFAARNAIIEEREEKEHVRTRLHVQKCQPSKSANQVLMAIETDCRLRKRAILGVNAMFCLTCGAAYTRS